MDVFFDERDSGLVGAPFRQFAAKEIMDLQVQQGYMCIDLPT